MDFLQLEYFLKLAKHQHVSHTANLLHISQPALSATIKKLENDLGTELFIRKGRNITLSPYGEVFKKYVEDAFLSIENGKQAITRMKNSDNTSLNLGILTPYIWNEVTHQFHNLYPEIQVNIYAIEKYDYFENLLSGEIDLYLGSINELQEKDMSKIEYITLYEDDMAILMSTFHSFTDKKEIDLRECEDEKFINLNSSSSLQHFTDHLWEKSGVSPNVVMSCDYTLRDRMVAKNYGISITTMRAATECDLPGVTFAKITNPADKRKLGLVWRKEKEFSPPMQKFYDMVTDIYKN